MGEDGAGPGETTGWHGWGKLGHGLCFQGLHQDAFHSAHVGEVYVQGSLAGGIETLRRVGFAQADELVPLPDPGPGVPVRRGAGQTRPPPVPAGRRCA